MTESGSPRFDFEPTDASPRRDRLGARITVVGVGGAGGNAINRMIDDGLTGVRFVAVNTDMQALDRSKAEVKIQIGKTLTRGLGAGARPQVGRDAAEENMDDVLDAIGESDIVFITAGMGGGTGTGAAPAIARRVREANMLTVAIVTTPFPWEAKVRAQHAEDGVAELRAEATDTLIVVPNARLLDPSVLPPGTSFKDALRVADGVLMNATHGIVNIINRNGEINTDFADIRTILSDGGDAILGSGTASGPNAAKDAAVAAVRSPLLGDVDLGRAQRLLVNVRASSKLDIMAMNEALQMIQRSAHPDAELIFGWDADDDLGEQVNITVVATAFGHVLEDDMRPAPVLTALRPSPPSEIQAATRVEPAEEGGLFRRLRNSVKGKGGSASEDLSEIPPRAFEPPSFLRGGDKA